MDFKTEVSYGTYTYYGNLHNDKIVYRLNNLFIASGARECIISSIE